jgi:DNA ligase-1
VNARTCKHLQSFLGADYEAARLKYRNPDGPTPKAAKKAAGKRKKADDEDGDEDGEEEGGSSGKTVPGLLLANKWDIETGPDPTGWLISEKLDGVRLVWFPCGFWLNLDVHLQNFLRWETDDQQTGKSIHPSTMVP